VIRYVSQQLHRHPDRIPRRSREPTDPGREPGFPGKNH
jgi:hypothetical protein